MLKLKDLFGSLGAKDGRDDASRIRAAIEKVEAEQRSAQEDLRKIAEQRTTALLDDDDALLDKLDRRAETQHRILERCEFALPELQSRLDAAQNRDADATRRARYEAAIAAAKQGRAAIKRYPTLAKQLIEVLKDVAIAEQAIEEANDDLPDGFNRIVSVEQEIRGLPTEARTVVSEKLSKARWYHTGAWRDAEVEETDLDKIVSRDGKTGLIKMRLDGSDREMPVVKRRRKITEFYPGLGAYMATPLAGGLALPGFLPGQDAIWTPIGGDPTFHVNEPKAVLAAVQKLEAEGWKQPMRDPRDRGYPSVTEEFVGDEPTAEEIAAMEVLG